LTFMNFMRSPSKWNMVVTLLVAVLFVSSLYAYPTEQSREAASEHLKEAAQELVKAAVEMTPLVCEAPGPATIVVAGALAGMAINNALEETAKALEAARNRDEDIMSSRGLMEYNIDQENQGTCRYEYEGRMGTD
jgi:hypothetical protein